MYGFFPLVIFFSFRTEKNSVSGWWVEAGSNRKYDRPYEKPQPAPIPIRIWTLGAQLNPTQPVFSGIILQV